MARNKPKTLIYLAILIGSFLLLFVRSDIFSPVKLAALRSSSLPIRIVSFPFREMKKMLYYHRTFDEYLRFRKEVGVLKGRLMGLEEVVKENTRLEKLLSFKRKLVYSAIAASVIGRDPSNWNATMLIDQGTVAGVQVGMPVVNAQGVVGKVAEVFETQAKVILVSDPNFSVAALDLRSRESGLVSGTLLGMCRLRYLSARSDVRVGDRVITSKQSSAFPEGLLVGEVISVQFDKKNPIIDCIVQPAVSLSQIEEVLVIQMK